MKDSQFLPTSVVFAILLVCVPGVQPDAACSSSSRLTDVKPCLQKVRAASTDVSRFWFGSGYASRCPFHMPLTINCFDAYYPTQQSLADRIFGPGTFQSQNVDRYLDLTFTSGPGEYTGCDYHYKQTTPKTFTIDPLSMLGVEPWHLRSLPAMKWTSKSDEQYTLVVIDVRYGFVDGLFMNIRGNDVSGSTVVKPYRGPRNPRDVPNPYAFLLFKQTTQNIGLSPHWGAILRNPILEFNISEFMTDTSLQGPVAINWMLASYDPWSVQQQNIMALGILFMENCAPLVQRALKTHSRPFLPSSLNLKVVVRISITTPALSIKFCCKDYTYPATTVTLDPIGNGKQLTANVRTTDSTVKVEFQMNKIYPNKTADFNSKMYTLLCVDPDVPGSGFQSKPLLHWMVLNIKHGDVATGTQMRSYRGPMPPDDKPHYYYFLLYEQTSSLNVSEDVLKKYFTPNAKNAKPHFDISKFTSDNSFTLVGATWMVSENDAFVNNANIAIGRLNETQTCMGKPGFVKPCPIGGASGVMTSSLLLIALLVLTFTCSFDI